MKPASTALVAWCAWLALSAPQVSKASGQSEAQRLFDEAQTLRAGGKYAEACPKLEESQQLDPAVGTLLYLADCYEQTGRTLLAWRSFREAERSARQAGQTERAELAAKAMRGLEKSLGRVSLRLGKREPALRIWVDGVELARSDWAEPFPVEPGEHRIEAGLGDDPTWSGKVAAAAGAEPAVLEIPWGAALGEGASDADAEPADVGPGAQEIAALVVGSVGLVGLAVGIGVGVDARNRYADSDDYCNEEDVCQPEGIRLRDEAQSQALGADITLVASGVLVAAGLVLWLTAPSELEAGGAASEATARWRIVPAPGSVSVAGAW